MAGHVKTKYRNIRRLLKELLNYEGQKYPVELHNWIEVALDKGDFDRTEELLEKERMYWERYPARQPELISVTEKYKKWL